jgi:hypothetical protein
MKKHSPGVIDDHVVVTTDSRCVGWTAWQRDVCPCRPSVGGKFSMAEIPRSKDMQSVIGGGGLGEGAAQGAIGSGVFVVATNN